MKRYEGLFILNLGGREEGLKDVLDGISRAIADAGGKVEATQKMENRQFTRVADKRFKQGYYVNVVFELAPDAVKTLNAQLMAKSDVFRVLIHLAGATAVVVETEADAA